jgi:alpha-glucosidase
MINWWMDRGIDGFRIDAISHMRKEPGLADMPNPDNLEFVPSYDKHMNVPGIQDYLNDICKNTFVNYDIMTVGEANGVDAANAEEWVGAERKKLNMIIQFEHVGLWDTNPEKRIDLNKVKDVFTRWQKGLEGRGWNALFVENHDVPRIVSKWGDVKNYWQESSTAIATMYFMMQGTPFIYQGQEIGMTNSVWNGPEDFNDVSAKNTFAIKRKAGVSDAEITAELSPATRDNARTPMQWSGNNNAGFTTGKPWLKVNPNFTTVNVAQQMEDKKSILNYYKAMIKLRKSDLMWVYGNYDLLLADHPQIYAYTRTFQNRKAVIITNISDKAVEYSEPSLQLNSENLLLANYEVAAHGTTTQIELRPYEARIYGI